MKEELLSVKEVSEILKTSPSNVYQKIRRGYIPARKMGKKVIILRSELEKAIRNLPKK